MQKPFGMGGLFSIVSYSHSSLMIIALASQFHGANVCLTYCLNCESAFNQWLWKPIVDPMDRLQHNSRYHHNHNYKVIFHGRRTDTSSTIGLLQMSRWIRFWNHFLLWFYDRVQLSLTSLGAHFTRLAGRVGWAGRAAPGACLLTLPGH